MLYYYTTSFESEYYIPNIFSLVQVLFDEEFAGGKSLQGMCSPFRGALVAWSSVLKVSRNTLPGQPHHKMGNSAGLAIPSGNAATQHTKGQLPPAKAKKSKDSTVPAGMLSP